MAIAWEWNDLSGNQLNIPKISPTQRQKNLRQKCIGEIHWQRIIISFHTVAALLSSTSARGNFVRPFFITYKIALSIFHAADKTESRRRIKIHSAACCAFFSSRA